VIVTGDAVCHYVASKTNGEYFGGGVGFGIERAGQIVCGVMFENFTGRSLQIHVAKTPDARMSRAWLRALFGYAFDECGVNKIIGVIDSDNADSLRFTRHIGFVDEAIIKDVGPSGDFHILTMTRQQCRFLKE